MPNNERAYLGDGVYVEEDNGFQLKFTVDYGNGPVETIFMDEQVLAALDQYRAQLKAKQN